jgi:hypothetical protein
MSIRQVQSIRLSSFLRSAVAVTSKPTLSASGKLRGPVWRGAVEFVRLAAVLLIAIAAVCSPAAAQTAVQIAHFSGARSNAVSSSRNPVGEAVRRDSTPAGNFGTVNVGATSAPMTLTFAFDAAVMLGSASVVTQGAPNLDFADAGTGTCSAGTAYGSGNTCTVDVTFTPMLAGTRYGAAVLSDNSGNVIATGYVQGTGSGPLLNFLPGTESIIGSGINVAAGVVVDVSGNVYIDDLNNSRVLKETWTGTGYTQSTFLSEPNVPSPTGWDGAGNLYMDNVFLSDVEKWTRTGNGYVQTPIGSGLYVPSFAAPDGAGNVYISDAFNGRVLKETLSADSYTQSVILTCGVYGLHYCPSSVAVDGRDNLYISAWQSTSTFDSSKILKMTPSAGGYTQSTIGSGMAWDGQVVVDGTGNLFAADGDNNRILRETLSAGSYIQSTVTSSSLNGPWGVAVDGSGNVYIPDTFNNRVLKEDLADAPSLSFTTANNGPQTVTVENVGNAPLIFPVPSTGNNPSISENFTLDSSAATACPVISAGASSPGTLAAAATCTLTISATGAGAYSGSLVLTDTNLNAPAPAYATQSIALAATIPSQVTLSASAAQVQVGQPITLTATVIVPSGGATPTGQVTFAGAGTPAPVATLNSSGVATFSSSTLALGTYSVTASYSGDSNYLGGSSKAVAFTVTGFASQTTLGASATQIKAGQSLTLTATVTGATDSATPTGNVTFSGVGSTSPSAALNGSGLATWTSSTLSAGNYAATANYPGDATHNPSVSSQVYFSVAAGPPANVAAVGGPNWASQYGYGVNICAEVTDANGNELAGITVSFGGMGLAFTPASPVTNTNGQACTAVTAPPALGSYVATASVSGVSNTATFNLTVTPAPLTLILSGEDSRVYGAANPNPVVKARGLVNGDTLGGTLIVTAQTTATPSSPVGFYSWTAPALSGTSAGNYTVTFVNTAKLHVRPAPLQVFPGEESSIYGQTPAPPTYRLNGFVNGDTASVVSGAPVLTTTVTSTTPVGVYKIESEAGTLTATNYTFFALDGALRVYHAPLTVTANSVTMTQGSAVPSLTYTLAGFVNGDTAAVVTGAPLLWTMATSSSSPGTYPILVYRDTLSAENYDFIQVEDGGVLTVTP